MIYTELVALSIAYADRYDAEVSDNIDQFIIMVEARINRLLKTRKQSSRAYTTTRDGQDFYSLPPDWAGMRDMQLSNPDYSSSSSKSPYSYCDPKSFEAERSKNSSKLIYTIIANQMQIHPIQSAGQQIEMIYFQKVPNLNATDFTNWLSEDNPDIYVAGVTAEIELFAKNNEAASGWFDRMKTAVGELDNVDWVERWSGDPLQIRLG